MGHNELLMAPFATAQPGAALGEFGGLRRTAAVDRVTRVRGVKNS